jgi:cytochrome bd-type quinol oxidase subunit 2
MTIHKGILIIATATLASFMLANTIDMSRHELGALINWFWPPIVGVLSVLIFLLVCWSTKNNNVRKGAAITFSLYLVYIGIALHFEKDYWPLVLF